MRTFLILLLGIFLLASAHATTLTLTSTDFSDNNNIPFIHTCDGQNLSPALSWNGTPPGTQSFVLIISDPDAPSGTFYHWVVFNIPKDTNLFKPGIEPSSENGSFGINSFGSADYKGPCPPEGSAHHYNFSLYALDSTLTFIKTPDAPTVLSALKSHILERAELTALYKRKSP